MSCSLLFLFSLNISVSWCFLSWGCLLTLVLVHLCFHSTCGGCCHLCPKLRLDIFFLQPTCVTLCAVPPSRPAPPCPITLTARHLHFAQELCCFVALLFWCHVCHNSLHLAFPLCLHRTLTSLLPQLQLTFLSDHTLPHLELHVLLLSFSLVIIFSAAVSLCVWVFVWMSSFLKCDIYCSCFFFFPEVIYEGKVSSVVFCLLVIHDELHLQ